jgi:hypothetical protein
MLNLFSNPLVKKWSLFLMFVILIGSSICAYFGVWYHLGPDFEVQSALFSLGIGLLFYTSILTLINQILKVKKNGFMTALLLILTLSSSVLLIAFSGNFLNTHLNCIDDYRSSIENRFTAVENQLDDYKKIKTGYLQDHEDVVTNSFVKLYSNNSYGDLLSPPFNYTTTELENSKRFWRSINAAKKSAADRHNEFKKKILSCDQSVIEKFRLYFKKFNQTSRSNMNMNHFDVGLPVKLQYADRILESYEIKELTSLVTCFTNNILISGLSGKFNNRPEMQVWLNKSQDIIDSSLDSDHLKVSSLLKTNDIKIFLIMILQFLLLILPVMMINQSSFSPRGSKGEFEL